jgi:ketosteroid isomerase-like protein
VATKTPSVLASDVLLAINDKDYGTLDKLSTEDVQLRFPPGQLFNGRRSLEQFLREVERRLPTMTLIGHHVHTGDDFAVVEYEVTGKTPSNREYEGMGCLVLEFEQERVKAATLYVDTAQWQQIQQG